MVCLIIVSTSGPDLSRFRLSLVRLVTRSAKARFGQVGNQVSKVKDHVGQGQGQELDNNSSNHLKRNHFRTNVDRGTHFFMAPTFAYTIEK